MPWVTVPCTAPGTCAQGKITSMGINYPAGSLITLMANNYPLSH